MPQIDVTELLTDPDFVGEIIQITRQTRVNSLGENILTECPIKTVVSVPPANGKEIERLPEAQRVANLMNFYFKGTIIASAPGKYSDILVFRGQRFQVLLVQDWSAWGAGYCAGLCVAEVPSL